MHTHKKLSIGVNRRLMPLRFAYLPDKTVEIVTTEASTSSAPSRRRLARRNAILRSTSIEPEIKDKFRKSIVVYESFVQSIKDGQKEQTDLIRGDFQQCFSELQMSMAKNLDLQQEMRDMQLFVLNMQQQALDRLAVIQGRIQALLTQTYELHEYPIPRLFIVLPKDVSSRNPSSILNKQFQLYFLCECGEHTKVLNDDNTKIPHHIHLAKHEGYDLQRPKEFFQKYGRYMLTLLEMIKYGVMIAGFAVPGLATVSTPGAINMFKNSLDTISQSAVDQSIKFLQEFSNEDPDKQDSAKDHEADSMAGLEALEGADLRHLEAFIKNKDQHRVLGNLYRIVTQEGHVKWICLDHYRLAYKEKDQQDFAAAVELNGGRYDPRLGLVAVKLGSKILAKGFFEALVRARHVDELDITLDWECTRSDLEALESSLSNMSVSILRLDLGRFRTNLGSKLLPTSTGQQVLSRIISLSSMKMVHIILPIALAELPKLSPTRLSHPPKLSCEVALGLRGWRELERIAKELKTNSTLIALSLRSNYIVDSGALELFEALKINSTLITLDLSHNSIGDRRAAVLTEQFDFFGYLDCSIGRNGAVALSEALKINSTLTTLNLDFNSIGDNGAVALSEALKTNSALTALYMQNNLIGDCGAVALSEALKTNLTLTTLDLSDNPIRKDGAMAK
ncbi:hypothetical protein EC991_002561 [Linnemannia zychae]|nr:hypothetical protein EC991_002561 [Linnemannia zychae]